MEEEVVNEFENVKKQLNKINWRDDILKPSNHVEKCHFLSLIQVVFPFSKGTKFLNFPLGKLAIKKNFVYVILILILHLSLLKIFIAIILIALLELTKTIKIAFTQMYN